MPIFSFKNQSLGLRLGLGDGCAGL